MDVKDRFVRALDLVTSGADAEGGLTALAALWEEAPQQIYIGAALSAYLIHCGHYAQAAEMSRAAYERNPNQALFLKNLSVALKRMGLHEQSEQVAFQLIEHKCKEHGGLEGVLHLARMRMTRDDIDGVIQLFEAVAETPELTEWAVSQLLLMMRVVGNTHPGRSAWVDRLIRQEPGQDDPDLDGPVSEADVTGSADDPAAAAALLRRYGCVIFRGVFDPKSLATVGERLDGLSQQDQELGFRAFADVTGGPAAAAAMVPLAVGRTLAYLWGVTPQLSMENCWGRHVGPNAGEYLHWHQDVARIYRNLVVCWTPLDRCGVEAPGLELAARRVKRLLDKDVGMNAVNEMEMSEAELNIYAPPETRMTPEFFPGDCALFFTSQSHRTHITPSMTKVRRSLEFRFEKPCPQWS